MNQFREQVCDFLYIEKHKNWERKRDGFITQIQSLKTQMHTGDINLEECEGFCVGDYENNGCTVIFDHVKNKISALIDFNRTKAEICSIVIFTGELDVSDNIALKKIEFELKVSDTISIMEIECRLKNRDVRKEIATSSDWENYNIPLTEFGGGISEWESLKEIKFLLRRKYVSGGKVEIKNMKIE